MEFNKQQKRIINNKPNGHFLIKGERFTGKTTACINKIPSLLNHYCIDKEDKILIATLGEEASDRVSYIYENIEAEKYHQNSFFDADNSDKLEIRTIEFLVSHYFNQYKKEHHKNIYMASDKECENFIREAMLTVADKDEMKKVNILKEDFLKFVQKEVTWIKACNFTSLDEYQNANRPGRINELSYIKEPKVLRKNSKQRQAIYEVLKQYNDNLAKVNKIDCQDKIRLALHAAKTNNTMSYVHIIIADSEMLSKIQLEFLKALYNDKSYSSLTFIFEINKTKAINAWLTNGKSFASLGYAMKGKSVTFKMKYLEAFKESLNNENIINKATATTIEGDNSSNERLKLDTIKYIDLKRNVHHNFIKDYGEAEEIYIEYNGIEEKVEEVICLPVFSEIAAGNPILMNEYIEDNYYLPKEWVRSSKDVFMLKVKGDSMINKGICDGDYVVISKQSFPSLKDIVAVDIDGEATLKTYTKINKQIVLMPENEKYSPIFITDQTVNFLGVAIGLIKN